MSYLGRATDIKFETKLNGTHTLTFQLPDRYFDSEKGDYVRNEFVDNLFNEKKIKLYFLGEWYEFYIKTVSDTKHFKSYMKKYSCTDAFIDELSRNGYGITFDTELYNNVEEIGTFSRVILEDSIWSYTPEYNWGDFTEYLEEKLFKIPVGKDLFPTLVGHKLTYEIENPRQNEQITNAFTREKRGLELGDDLAAAVNGKGGYFWDSYDGTMPLMSETMMNIPNDGYIYVPYSQLEFCYKTTSTDSVLAATEEVCYYDDKSYAIAPNTVDPTALIQFIAIPEGAAVEIDEAGLLLNKNYTYVMTVAEWNRYINSKYYYQFLPKYNGDGKKFMAAPMEGYEMEAVGNMAAYYEGYLDKINDIDVIYGKKISISDRTEVNVTDDIDQYVKVYNQKFDNKDLKDLYINPDDLWQNVDGIEYRVCSKTETREIVPQLARNYLQNGTKIKTTDGWEPCKIFVGDDDIKGYFCSNLQLRVGTTEAPPAPGQEQQDYVTNPKDTFLEVFPCLKNYASTNVANEIRTDTYHSPAGNSDHFDYYNTIINFGIVGQEKELIKDTIYCLGIKIGFETKYDDDEPLRSLFLRIGEGKVVTNGEYDMVCPETPDDDTAENGVCISLKDIAQITEDIETIRVKSTDGKDTLTKDIRLYEGYIFIRFNKNIDNPYFGITASNISNIIDEEGDWDDGDEIKHYTKVKTSTIPNYYIFNTYLFEGYTKGIDQFTPEAQYRYSGRELYDLIYQNKEICNCSVTDIYSKESIHQKIIFEEDVMPGDTYSYQKYFIQQVIAHDVDEKTGVRNGNIAVSDTFAQKEILSDYADLIAFKNTNVSHHDLPYSAAQFNNDDIDISTKYIDLNKCKYYNKQSNKDTPDCSYKGEHLCLYQKYGYCPYLFETEKHCRKIRTLNGEKSNRFNLTQELSKVFEAYPVYWTEHYENGKIKTETVEYDETMQALLGLSSYEKMKKNMFFIKEKGMENKLGFRYEKNLSNISRDIKSNQIVTKLYVADVDSELSKTGLCSIKTAEDNPSKDSFIINFNYYTTKGILNKDTVDADLYGKGRDDQGYLKQLGYLNTEYDKLSNAIINLTTSSFNELQANIETNVTAIETAQKQLFKLRKGIAMYESKGDGAAAANSENQSYQNQIVKYNEQLDILNNLIYETFFDQVTDQYLDISQENNLIPQPGKRDAVMTFFDDTHDVKWMQDSSWFKQHTYNLGMLGQFNREYLQIAEWKKKQAYYLKEINKLTLRFFRKYEPYLKEGTWTDSDYITDNAYYFGAMEVSAENSIPKVTYNINVIDLYALSEYEDYLFRIADTTYIEDIGMFGINPITGLPNRLKVIISGINYDLDEPSKNNISIQNFTTQFDDLFQQVTATVQSLTFNENIYKRASNFTSNQNIDQDSLQGTLDTNEMQLIKTDEANIQINKEGQSGSDINNHSNQYRLNGQGMEFSTNGGQTWDVGVGPGGINADYIKVGTLDAGKIRIVDNSYLYFLWDKNGISAFRDPQSLSSSQSDLIFNYYALFNKYGLSLVENGLIRLRAGYSYNGSVSGSEAGKINTERVQGQEIGFYLYDNRGIPIFKTYTTPLDEQSEQNLTARIGLKGEIYVSDADIQSTIQLSDVWAYTNAYRFNRLNVHNLSNVITLPSEVDYFDITMSPFDLTQCANYLNYHIMAGNIPDNTDWENTPLVVTDNTLVYNVYVTQIDTNSYGSYLQNDILYLENIDSARVHVKTSVTTSSSVITTTAVSEFYLKQGNNIYSENTQEILYCPYENIDRSIIVTSSSLYNQIDKIGYIQAQNGQNTISISTLTPFYYNNNSNYGFTSQERQEAPPIQVNGAAGLYINNKIALEDQTISGDQRLFCCAKDDSGQARNIFSIKKDGSLYMGGVLYNTSNQPITESSNVDDEILVKEANIYIENGVMHIDFNKIVDKDGQTLINAIADAVAGVKLVRHRHEIKQIKGTFTDNGTFAYLPTANDLAFRFDLTADGVPETNLSDYLKSHPDFGFQMMESGTGTIYGTHGSVDVKFSNKVLIVNQSYELNCINSYTEYTGSGSESGGGPGAPFSNWGYRNIIE